MSRHFWDSTSESASLFDPSGRAMKHHGRNTGVMAAVEAFWGLGMNFVSQGTVLPVFLAGLGAANRTIALVPVLAALGAGLPQAFSGLLVRGGTRLKWLVLWLHVLAPLPLGMIAAATLVPGVSPIPFVLGGWALFYALLGLLFPIWLEYMARILDPARRGRAFGIIFFTQTLAGMAGVGLSSFLLGRDTSLGTYALLFVLACASMSLGSFPFFWTAEEGGREKAVPLTVGGHLKGLAGLARSARWFFRYMAARWLIRGSYPLLIHFYAVVAVKERGFSPAGAASLGVAALAAQALAGYAAGALGDRAGHKTPVILGQGCLAAATILVLLPLPPGVFYGVAALTGAFLATEYTSQTNWVMELAGPAQRQSALALVGFLLTPAAVLAPLAGGIMMDRTGFAPVAMAVAAAICGAMAIEIAFVPRR